MKAAEVRARAVIAETAARGVTVATAAIAAPVVKAETVARAATATTVARAAKAVATVVLAGIAKAATKAPRPSSRLRSCGMTTSKRSFLPELARGGAPAG